MEHADFTTGITEYYTPAEAAAELRLSAPTVRRMCERGDIQARRCGVQWRIVHPFVWREDDEREPRA